MVSEVFLIDQMEYMSTVEDNFFDLVLADPPYGINAPNMQMGANANIGSKGGSKGSNAISTAPRLKGRLNSGGGKLKNRSLNLSSIDWDNEKPSELYFKELFRISKNQIIWGGNYFTSNLPESRCWIVWNKKQPWDNFSQAELAWTSFDEPMKLFSFSNRGGSGLEKIHPTEKPYYLYHYCLKHFAKQGDKIFDPGFGSGMSRIVAFDLGFEYWGTELNQSYFKSAEKRFNEHKKQGKLFKATPDFKQVNLI